MAQLAELAELAEAIANHDGNLPDEILNTFLNLLRGASRPPKNYLVDNTLCYCLLMISNNFEDASYLVEHDIFNTLRNAVMSCFVPLMLSYIVKWADLLEIFLYDKDSYDVMCEYLTSDNMGLAESALSLVHKLKWYDTKRLKKAVIQAGTNPNMSDDGRLLLVKIISKGDGDWDKNDTSIKAYFDVLPKITPQILGGGEFAAADLVCVAHKYSRTHSIEFKWFDLMHTKIQPHHLSVFDIELLDIFASTVDRDYKNPMVVAMAWRVLDGEYIGLRTLKIILTCSDDWGVFKEKGKEIYDAVKSTWLLREHDNVGVENDAWYVLGALIEHGIIKFSDALVCCKLKARIEEMDRRNPAAMYCFSCVVAATPNLSVYFDTDKCRFKILYLLEREKDIEMLASCLDLAEWMTPNTPLLRALTLCYLNNLRRKEPRERTDEIIQRMFGGFVPVHSRDIVFAPLNRRSKRVFVFNAAKTKRFLVCRSKLFHVCSYFECAAKMNNVKKFVLETKSDRVFLFLKQYIQKGWSPPSCVNTPFLLDVMNAASFYGIKGLIHKLEQFVMQNSDCDDLDKISGIEFDAPRLFLVCNSLAQS